MSLAAGRRRSDASDSETPQAPRLAFLPRAIARALEQLIDTMLCALRAGSGAMWMEHERTVYTLVTRSIPLQNLQLLQQAIQAHGQPSPTVIQAQGNQYAVACAGYPLLRVYTAVEVEAMRPAHHRLLPRFARLAQTLLQAGNLPLGTPTGDSPQEAYRVVVESSLRRLCELLKATGCMLLWFSSWNNSWHRFAVGSVPDWLYQQIWEMPSPGGEIEEWIRGIEELVRHRGQYCATDAMTVREMVKGCVFLWRTTSHGDFSNEELDWLGVIVQMMAASLDVLETQTELLQRVYQDPLTGVFNRLYFDIAYQQILHNAQRHPRPVSLLLMDIDNFKHLNDTCGHEMGDLVLQLVGQTLQQVRSGDIPARYGGDEFVVLLPDTDKAGALALAQRLKNTLTQTIEQLGLPFQLTLSIGCATVADGDASLLLLADQDMYEKKRKERTAAE
jgi:diguanylate cyclase (GGDEF)-like protein